MGKVNQGILGALSGSVGHVTGASVKGIPTLRTKAISVADPKTASQMVERTDFAEAANYCRENREAIMAQEGFRDRKGLSIWNQMISWYRKGGRLIPVCPYPTIDIDGKTCIDANEAGWLDQSYGNIVYAQHLIDCWGILSPDNGIAIPRGYSIPENPKDALSGGIFNNADGTCNVSLAANGLMMLSPESVARELILFGKEVGGAYVDKFPVYIVVPDTESLISFEDAKWYYTGTTLVVEVLKQNVPGFEGMITWPAFTLYTKDGQPITSKRDTLQTAGASPSFKKFSFNAGTYQNNPVVGDDIQFRLFYIGAGNTPVYYSSQLVSIPSRD